MGVWGHTCTNSDIYTNTPYKKKRFSSISPTPGAQNRHLYHYCIIFPHRFRYVSFRAVASCSLFFKNVVDAYKKWATRESILVTKSLRKISVHKIAIINASHYGMARVSRGGNTNYKNDFFWGPERASTPYSGPISSASAAPAKRARNVPFWIISA